MTEPSSPLPWKIDPAEDLPLAIIQDTEDGLGVAEGDVGRDEFQRQDFEYIVEACNNYPTAVRLLRRAYLEKDSMELFDKIEKFLKSIENGQQIRRII